MATNILDLMATLGLDSSEFDSGLSKAKSVSSKFSSGLKSVLKGVVGTVTAVSTAIAGIGVASVKAGKDFETAFAKVRTIMDSTEMSTENMSEGILALSSSMGIANKEISDLVYNAISATGDTANSLELATQASKLAIAGFTDSTSALSVLTTAMNAYGKSANEVAHISDVLIQTQNLGVTTVGELASDMGRAIATASAYGVTLENLSASYVALTKAGISSRMSTTYLSSMLSELGDEGSKVGKILQAETGMGFSELISLGYSLGDVLSVLNASVDGNATALINLWGSMEAGKAANAIVSQGLENFNENLAKISTQAGVTEEAYSTMADTFERKASVLKTSIQNLMATIGTELTGKLGVYVDFFKDAIDELNKAYESGGLNGIVTVMGQVMADGLARIMDALPSFLEQGGNLMLSLGNGIAKNAGTIVSRLSEALANGVQYMIDNMEVFVATGADIIVSIANGLTEKIPDLVSKIPTLIMKLVKGIADNLPLLITAGGDMLIAIVNGMFDKSPAEIVKFINDLVNQLFKGFATAVESLFKVGVNIATAIWQGIKGESSGWDWDSVLNPPKEEERYTLDDWLNDPNAKARVAKALDGKDLSGMTLSPQMQSFLDELKDWKEEYLKELEKDSLEIKEANQNAYSEAFDIEFSDVEQSATHTLEELRQMLVANASDPDTVEELKGQIVQTVANALGLATDDPMVTEKANEFMSGILGGGAEGGTAGVLQEVTYSWEAFFEDFKEGWYDGVETAEDRLEYLSNVTKNFASTMKKNLMTAFTSAVAGVKDLTESVVTGSFSWKEFGASALDALSQVLSSLGSQLAALSVTKFVMGDWAAGSMALAGSVAAFAAAGVASGVSANLRSAREAQTQSYGQTDSGYSSGGGVTVNQYIESVPLTAYELEQEAYIYAERLEWT